MQEIDLSVVIPNYNHAHYLVKQLDAVFSNTRMPDEVIVIDDCSSDSSCALLEDYSKYQANLKILKNESNSGAIFSCNRGINFAKGKYICVIAADDLVLPNFFKDALDLLIKYPESGLCLTRPLLLNDTTSQRYEHEGTYPLIPDYFTPEQLIVMIPNGFWLAGHASILRTKYLLEFGGFDPELKWHSDWYVNHMIAGKYGVCFHPSPGSALRIRSDSFSAEGMRDSVAQVEVLWKMAQKLQAPQFNELSDFFMKARLYNNFPQFKDDIAAAIRPISVWGNSIRERVEKLEAEINEINRKVVVLDWIISFLKPIYCFFKPVFRLCKK